MSSFEQLNLLGRGTTFLELSADELGSYKVGGPSKSEQVYISNFLDHETAKIDTLIEKQQQLITLLQEKRQAVISHAVTKGLNPPDAPMKDSGVEWLGKVPEHWETMRLKLFVKTRKGVAFKSDDFREQGIRVVKASDIKELSVRTSDVYLPKRFAEKYPKAVLRTNDIILSTVGSNPDVKNSSVGQIGKLPNELDGTLLNQNTVVYDPDESKVLKKYIFYLLQMNEYRDYLDLHAHGTANQSSLNIVDMLNFQVSFPPVDEQIIILNELKRHGKKIDTLLQKSERTVLLLQERRTALISAAVTGKIDVRNFKEKKSHAA